MVLPDSELWQREPFLALIMYVQMRRAFGWDAFSEVFAAYHAQPDSERPESDIDKRDPWLVRLSRRVDRNLGPFFETQGVPTSQLARDRIADLPMWLPHDFPTGRQNASPFRPIVASPSSPATCHCGSLVRVAFQQTRR